MLMKVSTARIVYFSGTGCTAKVAEAFHGVLDRRGIQTSVTEIDGRQTSVSAADLLVLLYPVYAANAPQPVREWLADLPQGKGCSAIVISVSGGGSVSPNTACRVYPIGQLGKKGYRVVCDQMIVMPSNFFLSYSDALCALLLREAPRRAERILDDALAGLVRHSRPLLRDRLLTRMLGIERYGSRIFGQRLHTDARCTGCGLCARQCPHGNIALRDGKPVFGARCVLCTRCLYGCPANAITPGFGKFMILKNGFDLNAIEKRTAGMEHFPPIEELTKGFAMNGVRMYLKG